jgi:transglutaminase-like putative cysteine protease
MLTVPVSAGSPGVTITYPTNKTFNADAFFMLEGSIKNPACYNYAYVIITKDSDPVNLRTTYLVNGNFKQRIWLRFGYGTYTIEVRGLASISFSTGGALGGLSFYTPADIVYKVTNTRNEDGLFIYPSYIVQSDDPAITSLAANLIQGKVGDEPKIKAIHDYIITSTVYDQASTVSGQRKKQDALSVLGTRYTIDTQYPNGHYFAVCEGYANVFAALARAAGLQTKYVSSKQMNHAWNNVNVGGVWKFMDVTWDDPSPDRGPQIIHDFHYKYYLLNNLTGFNNDHPGGEASNERSLIGIEKAPWRPDGPEGWY